MAEEIAGNIDHSWITARYIQDYLMVGKTKAYQIIREIEANNYAPDAVVKFDTLKASSGVRVRKDIFHRWVRECGIGNDDLTSYFIRNPANVYSLASRRHKSEPRLVG